MEHTHAWSLEQLNWVAFNLSTVRKTLKINSIHEFYNGTGIDVATYMLWEAGELEPLTSHLMILEQHLQNLGYTPPIERKKGDWTLSQAFKHKAEYANNPKLFSTREMCQSLEVTRQTLYLWRHHRIGSRLSLLRRFERFWKSKEESMETVNKNKRTLPDPKYWNLAWLRFIIRNLGKHRQFFGYQFSDFAAMTSCNPSIYAACEKNWQLIRLNDAIALCNFFMEWHERYFVEEAQIEKCPLIFWTVEECKNGIPNILDIMKRTGLEPKDFGTDMKEVTGWVRFNDPISLNRACLVAEAIEKKVS